MDARARAHENLRQLILVVALQAQTHVHHYVLGVAHGQPHYIASHARGAHIYKAIVQHVTQIFKLRTFLNSSKI